MKSFKEFLTEQKNQDQLTKLYRALISAEHRGVVKDPTQFDEKIYIRTKYEPHGNISTAYGPAQLTLTTLEDHLKRYPQNFSKEDKDYIQKFVEQGKKMMSADSKDPVYGYGCKGDLCAPEYHEPYERVAVGVLKGKLADAKIDYSKPLEGDNLNLAIQRWRGVGEFDTKNKKGKTIKGDPEYFKVVRTKFGEFIKTPQTQIATDVIQPKINREPASEVVKGIQFSDPHAIAFNRQLDRSTRQRSNLSIQPVQKQNIYTVKEGDTLYKIAKLNNTTVEEIAKANNIKDINAIRPGQSFKIPNKK
jgi:LysM repeat protein